MDSRSLEGPVVLVVEDNADDEAMALRVFQKHLPKGRFAVVRDGQAAIACVKDVLTIDGQPIERGPDFILLDLKIPRVPGLQVLDEIRNCERTKDTPVVVFSSSDAIEDVDHAYGRGANTYVQKPVEYMAYTEALNDICRYWFSLARLPS